ncbi:hypothetical protein J1614_005546 [Plenodomus biglobosus]|nr:hypothetical protein J1614_005546 [Plenodomus biglobosus]
MSPPTPSPFRLQDLPAELRNRIYYHMLCAFSAPPAPFAFPFSYKGLALQHARHSINTGILRTSRSVYNEAYSVLVKGNEFIKIGCVEGFPLRFLFTAFGVPVVAASKQRVLRFRHYALEVEVSGSAISFEQPTFDLEEAPLPPARVVMMLRRDLDRFCSAIAHGDAYVLGFSQALHLSVTVAPGAVMTPTGNSVGVRGTPVFDTFSEVMTQSKLLRPFSVHLQGYTAITLAGAIDRDLATATLASMARLKYTDPESILREFKTAERKGWMVLSEGGSPTDACCIWHDSLIAVRKVHGSSSWPYILSIVEPSFVADVADTWVRVVLAVIRSPLHKLLFHISSCIMQDVLHAGIAALRRGFWKEGYTHGMEDVDRGWLVYHCAHYLRTRGVDGAVGDAEAFIRLAMDLLPWSVVVSQERNSVLAWKFSLRLLSQA